MKFQKIKYICNKIKMMKKLLLYLSVVINTISYSQITFTQDSIHEVFDTYNNDVVIHNPYTIVNVPTNVTWEIYSIDVPSTWTNDIYVCDVSCYDETVNFHSYDITDTKPNVLDVHFLNSNNTGEGIAKLLIYETNDSANTAKIVTYHSKVISTVGIFDSKKLNFSIYPNPTSNKLNIKTDKTIDIEKIAIFNIIGKKLIETTLTTINVADLENGVYIIKLYGKDETLYHTQSFVKK